MKSPVIACLLSSALLSTGCSQRKAPVRQDNLQVLMCVFCDHAADNDGKLSLSGPFDTLLAKSVPVQVAVGTLCIRLQCLPAAYGDHKLRVEITKPDGKPLLEPELERSFNLTPKEPADFLTKNLLLKLNTLTFDQFGSFKAAVFIDDMLVSNQQLLLKKAEP